MAECIFFGAAAASRRHASGEPENESDADRARELADAKVILFDMGGTLIGDHDYTNFVEGRILEAMKPGALQLIRDLAARKRVMLGIVSNTGHPPEAILRVFTEQIGIAVDVPIFSSDPRIDKVCKPRAKIYAITLEVIDMLNARAQGTAACDAIQPHEIIFVGDSYVNDCQLPASFEMRTVYLKGQDTHATSREIAAVTKYRYATVVCHDIADLRNVLTEAGYV